eukprot:scaffold166086_cov46-Cyclotella_meneghiniana.AAC.1
MSSATEAELGALYIMAPEAVYMQLILEEMGHKWLMTLSTGKYNRSERKQWTSDSTRCENENVKNNSEYIGDQAN